MNLYKVICPEANENEPVDARYVGSKDEAAKLRTEWMKLYSVSRQYIVVDKVDVPTNKVGLLAFLNSLSAPE